MPELPEVETIRRVIEAQIRGLRITNVTVRRPEVIAYPAAADFCRQLAGQAVSRMTRRGKFLTFWLEGGGRVILHLRMTGCLLAAPACLPEEKHTHVVFTFSDGRELRFSDQRRFGRFWMLQKDETDSYSGIGRLGLEPFDGGLTAGYLFGRMGKRRKTIKECLLDQTAVAGIGNIYSDEILFTAGIYPACPANRLERRDWERLAVVIPERLLYFIEKTPYRRRTIWKPRGRITGIRLFCRSMGMRVSHARSAKKRFAAWSWGAGGACTARPASGRLCRKRRGVVCFVNRKENVAFRATTPLSVFAILISTNRKAKTEGGFFYEKGIDGTGFYPGPQRLYGRAGERYGRGL